MKLVENSILDFNKELASNSPTPGGGSVAALEGALAASLTIMVCELTLANIKYENYFTKCEDIKIRTTKLQTQFLDIIDEDSYSYNKVSEAYKLSKDSEEDKLKRSKIIQERLKESCVPPFKSLELIKEGIDNIEELINSFNKSCSSDLAVAISSYKASCLGEYNNVLINLKSIKDIEYIEEMKAKTDSIYSSIIKKCETLYCQVEKFIY